MKKLTESIFGFWNPTENTLKRFQGLRDVLAKDHARLELVILSRIRTFNLGAHSMCRSCQATARLTADWVLLFFAHPPFFYPNIV